MGYRQKQKLIMSRIREFENYFLLCGNPQEILTIFI